MLGRMGGDDEARAVVSALLEGEFSAECHMIAEHDRYSLTIAATVLAWGCAALPAQCHTATMS